MIVHAISCISYANTTCKCYRFSFSKLYYASGTSSSFDQLKPPIVFTSWDLKSPAAGSHVPSGFLCTCLNYRWRLNSITRPFPQKSLSAFSPEGNTLDSWMMYQNKSLVWARRDRGLWDISFSTDWSFHSTSWEQNVLWHFPIWRLCWERDRTTQNLAVIWLQNVSSFKASER